MKNEEWETEGWVLPWAALSCCWRKILRDSQAGSCVKQRINTETAPVARRTNSISGCWKEGLVAGGEVDQYGEWEQRESSFKMQLGPCQTGNVRMTVVSPHCVQGTVPGP